MEDHVARVLTKMDSDEEKLRYLGFLGIFKESFKIISSWKKIFAQITLFFILPLAIIFLVQTQVSNYLEERIRWARFDDAYNHDRYHRLYHILTYERLAYWLIKIAYLVFLLVLSLLSTSAVIYTVACNYTGEHITFKKIMSVVPKVWKRVAITFLWSFLIHLAYGLCMVGTFVMWAMLIGFSPFGQAIGFLLLIMFLAGYVYLSIIWQLASVVSVLEESYGSRAMVKSINLIEGKKRVTGFIFLLLVLFYVGIMIVYDVFVAYSWFYILELVVGIPCLILLTFLFLLGLVIQTVIYFVCKSYHCESIDKSALANHLECYFQAEPQSEATKDVQLKQVHVAPKNAQPDQVYV